MSYTSLRREPCSKCGSMDNLVVYEYEDGRESYHCFTPGCGNHKHSPEVEQEGQKSNSTYLDSTTSIPPVDLKGWSSFPRDMVTRKIKHEFLKKYFILYRFSDHLLGFPYYREAHYPVALKYRTIEKKFGWVGHSKDPFLFGKQTVTDNRKVLIITEGELDAVAANQMTGWAAVSVPNGAQGALKSLKYNLKWIEQFEKVYICFDNDEPGLAASEEAMNLIEKGKAYQVLLERKDPCEYLIHDDEEAFKDRLYAAKCRSTDALFDVDDLASQYEHYIFRDPEDIKGKKTGLKVFDEVFRLRQEEVTTFFANPTVGKSSIARQIAANWLSQDNGGILYFAFEESPVKWIDKLIQMLCDGDFRPEKKKEIYDKYRERIHSSRVYSYDLPRIREAIEYGVRSRGVSLVIFDNVTAACSSVGDYNETVRGLYSLFVELGKKHKHHTLVISHTKRDGMLKASSPPYLTSAYGSSGVEQFSDNVITFGREEGAHFTNVAIRKQRDTGEVGELEHQLEYDPILKRFKGISLVTKDTDNGRVEEEKPGDKNASRKTEKDKDTRTAESESEEPRVSRRREKNGQVRQQDGEKSPRGNKGGLSESGSRTDSESNQTLFGDNPLIDELQSRLSSSPSEWEEAVHRMQGALERGRQIKITKPSRVPPRQFDYGSTGCRPHSPAPDEDDLPSMGGQIRDYSDKRRGG